MFYPLMRNSTHSAGWSFKPGTPQIRGFDTPELYTEDTLDRVKWFAKRMADQRRKIEAERGL